MGVNVTPRPPIPSFLADCILFEIFSVKKDRLGRAAEYAVEMKVPNDNVSTKVEKLANFFNEGKIGVKWDTRGPTLVNIAPKESEFAISNCLLLALSFVIIMSHFIGNHGKNKHKGLDPGGT